VENDLIDTITSWMNEYGDRRISKKYGSEYIVIPISRRKELFRHLVKTIKDQGKEKDYFRATIMDTIVKACFPPEDVSFDRKKRNAGISTATRELQFVLAEVYKQKLSVAEQPEYVPTKDYIPDYNPAKGKPIARELDRSLFDEAPKPNTTVDTEAADILGFGDGDEE